MQDGKNTVFAPAATACDVGGTRLRRDSRQIASLAGVVSNYGCVTLVVITYGQQKEARGRSENSPLFNAGVLLQQFNIVSIFPVSSQGFQRAEIFLYRFLFQGEVVRNYLGGV